MVYIMLKHEHIKQEHIARKERVQKYTYNLSVKQNKLVRLRQTIKIAVKEKESERIIQKMSVQARQLDHYCDFLRQKIRLNTN